MAVVNGKSFTSLELACLSDKENSHCKGKKYNQSNFSPSDCSQYPSKHGWATPEELSKNSNYYSISKQKAGYKSAKNLNSQQETPGFAKEKHNVFDYQSSHNENIINIFKAQLDHAQKSFVNEVPALPDLNLSSESEEGRWTEPKVLEGILRGQKKKVEQGRFNPIEYFGCEYMKDYYFYTNNPRLECVFKGEGITRKPKEAEIELKIEDVDDFGVTVKDCLQSTKSLNLFKSMQNPSSGSIKMGNKTSSFKAFTPSGSTTTAFSKEAKSYIQKNNPKTIILNKNSSMNSLSKHCDTGGSSLTSQSSFKINLDSLSSLINSSKPQSKKPPKHQKAHKRPLKKMAQSVLDKSRSPSRSPSPKITFPKTTVNSSLALYSQRATMKNSLSKINSFGSQKLELYGSQRVKEAKGSSGRLGKSPSGGRKKFHTKLNYDSFYEYLNETSRSGEGQVKSAFGAGKKSKLSKNENLKLQNSIEAVLQAKEIKPKKCKKKVNQTCSNSSLNNSSRYRPKLDLSSTINNSVLNPFKPDYGATSWKNFQPHTVKNKSKPFKHPKARKGSSKRPSKTRSKSKKKKEYTSLERSIGSAERSVDGTINDSKLTNYYRPLNATKRSANSSALLCKKIKDDIKKAGSSKLSRYLKSCKEKKMPKQPTAQVPNSTKAFGQRGGSIQVQNQLCTVENVKSLLRKDKGKSSSKSRYRSKCSKNRSLERSQSGQRPMKSQRANNMKSCLVQQNDLKSGVLGSLNDSSSYYQSNSSRIQLPSNMKKYSSIKYPSSRSRSSKRVF